MPEQICTAFVVREIWIAVELGNDRAACHNQALNFFHVVFSDLEYYQTYVKRFF